MGTLCACWAGMRLACLLGCPLSVRGCQLPVACYALPVCIPLSARVPPSLAGLFTWCWALLSDMHQWGLRTSHMLHAVHAAQVHADNPRGLVKLMLPSLLKTAGAAPVGAA